MAVYRFQRAGLTAGNAAYQCWFYRVSGNYFDMLGIQPALGRLFHATDEHGPQSAPYIVLSNDFWRSRFASDPAIVGANVYINKHPFTVIGVAPAAFHGTDIFLWPDFWMPIVNTPDDEGENFLSSRFMHNLWILGQLAPGVALSRRPTISMPSRKKWRVKTPTADDGLSARLVKPGLMGDMFGGPARAFMPASCCLHFSCFSLHAPTWPVSSPLARPTAAAKSQSASPSAPAAGTFCVNSSAKQSSFPYLAARSAPYFRLRCCAASPAGSHSPNFRSASPSART